MFKRTIQSLILLFLVLSCVNASSLSDITSGLMDAGSQALGLYYWLKDLLKSDADKEQTFVATSGGKEQGIYLVTSRVGDSVYNYMTDNEDLYDDMLGIDGRTFKQLEIQLDAMSKVKGSKYKQATSINNGVLKYSYFRCNGKQIRCCTYKTDEYISYMRGSAGWNLSQLKKWHDENNKKYDKCSFEALCPAN